MAEEIHRDFKKTGIIEGKFVGLIERDGYLYANFIFVEYEGFSDEIQLKYPSDSREARYVKQVLTPDMIGVRLHVGHEMPGYMPVFAVSREQW